MQQLPEHGSCFVCGKNNPNGLGLRWFLRDDGSIYAQATLNENQQGAPGIAHGGALAAMLDEAMGAAAWQAGYKVLAISLKVDYLRPVHLGTQVEVLASVTKKEGRKVFARGEIVLPDGEKATVGEGIFVEAEKLLSTLVEGYQDRKSWA